MTVPAVRNQFGGVGCPAPPAHKDVLTVSTLLHLHKKKKKKTTSEGVFYGNMSSNVVRETGYWPSQRRASPKNTNA